MLSLVACACGGPNRTARAGMQGFILAPGEGDSVLSHLIKVDPERGSQRLGVGTQRIESGRAIALHIHDGEDELLYIVSGRGIGVVGNVEREVVTGSLIFVPQGAWHGLKAIEPIDLMWVVSPPNFARAQREFHMAGASMSEARREEIARKHQQSDSLAFLRLVLGNSEWQGEEPWGHLAFGDNGLTAVYRGADGGSGTLEIRDERREDLGFAGVWRGADGGNGKVILNYDFASGSAVHLDWGEDGGKRSTLRRVR